MSGTRKLDKFEMDLAPDPAERQLQNSGTQKLDKFVPPPDSTPAVNVINTPVSEPSPLVLDASRRSIPGEVTDEPPASDSRSDRGRNREREPQVERLRTQLARKFTTLADNVTGSFEEFQIGAGAWTVELTAPEGMSTKGGKQALQHLRLRPTRQGHAVLVGGIVNAIDKTAELRDYEHMEMICRARFGKTIDLTSGEWEQFLRKAEVVLRAEGIQTKRIAAPRDIAMLAQNAERASTKQKLAVALLAVVVFLSAIVIWRVIVALWP